MLLLSNQSKLDKNKLNSDAVWLVMLQINIPSLDETIYLVNNNEDIEWNANTYQRFPFDIDEMNETSSGETSQFSLKVANVNNVIGQYVREYETWVKLNGFEAITCTLYVVNTNDLENTTPVYSHNLVLNKSNITMDQVVFTITARDLYRVRTPQYRMFPNSCRFKFKSTQCGYGGSETTCNKSLANCRTYNNSNRFGGFPSIGNAGVSL